MTRIGIVTKAAVVWLALFAPHVSAHDGPHGGPDEVTFKVGKNGEVNLRQDVRFGSVLVKRGKYTFAHRLDGERHAVVLTEDARKEGGTPVVYEVPTNVISSRQVAKRTAVYARELADRSVTVTMIEVTGEPNEHLPQS